MSRDELGDACVNFLQSRGESIPRLRANNSALDEMRRS